MSERCSSSSSRNNMPFPTHPPRQMPCPHWNHFPINPAVQVLPTAAGASPPVVDSYTYCAQCAHQGTEKK